ncbi:MAG TPA: MFS transporter [Tepidiformaceae bacterium]|nr:MFS transporter [Tepidiformaceae bacterium]
MSSDASHPGVSVLVAMAAASFLAPLNSSMVAVALPDIRSSFGVSVSAATWLISGYLVSVAVAQPVGGRLGDAFGCRRMILVGLAVLLLSSLGAAASTTYPLLLLTRSLQGVSAAMVMPTAIAYLRKRTPVERLGAALGVNGAAVSLGAALGPVIGAALLVFGGWRWLFIVNVPLALFALVVVWRVPADSGRGRSGRQFDPFSLLALAGVFLGMAILGSARRLDNGALTVAAVAMLPAAIAFYLVRFRLAGSGLVDLRLFTKRSYSAAAATVSLSNLVMYTTLIAIPLYLADTRGVGDGAIGGLLFGMSVAIVVVSPVAGRYADGLGSRAMIVAGSAVLLAGSAVLWAVLHHPPLVVLAIPLVLMGVGLGLCQAAQQAAALKAWPGEMAGSAAGTLSMMRYVGSISGTALIAALLSEHPGESEFRLLFLVVASAGVACVGASLLVPRRSRRPDSGNTPVPEFEPELATGG